MPKINITRSELVFVPLSTHGNFQDLTNLKFNQLTVLGYAGNTPRVSWFCKCDCGSITVLPSHSLRSGKIFSCGCSRNKNIGISNSTHAMSSAYIYNIWHKMLYRCYNTSSQDYHRYGGRGITVCHAWRKSFETFYQDMGDRPSREYSLGRIDNDKEYSPENVEWQTIKEQSRNKSRNIYVTAFGKTQLIPEWSESTGISYKIIYSRIKIHKWCHECAVSKPPKGGGPPVCPHRPRRRLGRPPKKLNDYSGEISLHSKKLVS